jgi:hypothetical protein
VSLFDYCVESYKSGVMIFNIYVVSQDLPALIDLPTSAKEQALLGHEPRYIDDLFR